MDKDIPKKVVTYSWILLFGLSMLNAGIQPTTVDDDVNNAIEIDKAPVLCWHDGIMQWEELITKYATEYDLDPNLVAAVMHAESSGRPNAVSSAGATGLMQVMPYHPTRFPNRPEQYKLFDPDFNVAWGCAILRQYIDMFDDIFLGLGAYYAGSHAARSGRADAVHYANLILGHMASNKCGAQ